MLSLISLTEIKVLETETVNSAETENHQSFFKNSKVLLFSPSAPQSAVSTYCPKPHPNLGLHTQDLKSLVTNGPLSQSALNYDSK